MNLVDIRRLNDSMDKLAHGIDPITNMKFSEDTILNNRLLQELFNETRDVLQKLLDGRFIKSDYKRPHKDIFHIEYTDGLANAIIFKENVTISKFVYRINENIHTDMMKKLRAMEVTGWLVQEGYLEFKNNDNFDYKVATKQGNSIGITTVIKENANRESYAVNLYDTNAQIFLLKNMNRITGYVDSCHDI